MKTMSTPPGPADALSAGYTIKTKDERQPCDSVSRATARVTIQYPKLLDRGLYPVLFEIVCLDMHPHQPSKRVASREVVDLCCYILGDNKAGMLSTDALGTIPIPSTPYSESGEYFYHIHPKTTGSTLRASPRRVSVLQGTGVVLPPLICDCHWQVQNDFASWRFPTLPEITSLPFSTNMEDVEGIGPCPGNQFRGEVCARDTACILTGRKDRFALQAAHLVPKSQQAWLDANKRQMRLPASFTINDPRNGITLESSLHCILDHSSGPLLLIPEGPNFIAYFLSPEGADSYCQEHHGRCMRLHPAATRQSILALNAYSIIHRFRILHQTSLMTLAGKETVKNVDKPARASTASEASSLADSSEVPEDPVRPGKRRKLGRQAIDEAGDADLSDSEDTSSEIISTWREKVAAQTYDPRKRQAQDPQQIYPPIEELATSGQLVKASVASEVDFYSSTAPSRFPGLIDKKHIPMFYGTLPLEKPQFLAGIKAEQAIVIEDITKQFHHPNTLSLKLDSKMGHTKRKKIAETESSRTKLDRDEISFNGFKVYDARQDSYVSSSQAYGSGMRSGPLSQGIGRFFPSEAEKAASTYKTRRSASVPGLDLPKLMQTLKGILKMVSDMHETVRNYEWRAIGVSLLIVYEGDNAAPAKWSINLLDFDRTTYAQGQGSDKDLCRGLKKVVALLQGRMAELEVLAASHAAE